MRTEQISVTAEQLATLSHDGQRCELIRGELHIMSPAGGRHGRVAHNLALVLGQHVRQGNLGAVYAAETGFLIARNPDTVRAPDVAFVSRHRRQPIDDEAGYLALAPDLVGEVISTAGVHRAALPGRLGCSPCKPPLRCPHHEFSVALRA